MDKPPMIAEEKTMTPYSIQQIKFECLSYIKEFGARMDQWVIGTSDDPERTLASLGVDLEHDIWLWKPALSATAARLVVEFFTGRYQVRPALQVATPGTENCIFLYKKPN